MLLFVQIYLLFKNIIFYEKDYRILDCRNQA